MDFTIARALLLLVQVTLTLASAQDISQSKYVVKGRIVNGTGRPVPNAQIFIEPKGTTYRGCIIEYYSADDEGRFRIETAAIGSTEHWMLYVATPTPKGVDTPITLDRGASAGSEVLLTNQETDLGDVPVQVRYGLVLFRLPDESRGSLFYKDTRMSLVSLRVRDAKGDLVSDGSVSGAAVNEKEMTLLVALPEGQWQAEVSLEGVQGICIPDRTLLVKYSDQPSKFTLIPRKPESQSELLEDSNGTGPDEARRTLERMGISYNEEAFLERVRRGNTRAVKLFLAAGMGPNVKNVNGETALMFALSHVDLVKMFLAHGADVEARTQNGLTALLIAAGGFDPEVVKCLIDRRSNVNAKDNAGQTPLMYAVSSGRAEHLELLLAAGSNVDAKDEAGNTALMLATERGEADAALILLSAGAEIHSRNKEGSTALMNAAASGNFAMVNVLLNKGAKVNVQDKNGFGPLILAASRGDSQIVERLKTSGAIESLEAALIYATKRGDADAALSLLEKGANASVRYPDGETLLIEAAKQGNTTIVRGLLSKDADVNAQIRTSGRSALMEAARQGTSEIVNALLDRGARVNDRDLSGTTALMFAASDGRLGVIKVLLARGADAKAIDNRGWTALKHAERAGESAVVEVLQRIDVGDSGNK